MFSNTEIQVVIFQDIESEYLIKIANTIEKQKDTVFWDALFYSWLWH